METLQTRPSNVRKIAFNDLVAEGKNALPFLVNEYGIVYVTSITRDGCSGCIEQKPLFEQLAMKIEQEHPGKTRFSNIHIHYQDNHQEESQEAKSMLGHASYPTYMVHVNSRHGPLEHYRAAYPKMEELEQQITNAFELAEHYRKDNH
jgi:hypothetical protein